METPRPRRVSPVVWIAVGVGALATIAAFAVLGYIAYLFLDALSEIADEPVMGDGGPGTCFDVTADGSFDPAGEADPCTGWHDAELVAVDDEAGCRRLVRTSGGDQPYAEVVLHDDGGRSLCILLAGEGHQLEGSVVAGGPLSVVRVEKVPLD